MFTFLMHRQKHCFLYTTIYKFSSNLLLATFYNRLHLNRMPRNMDMSNIVKKGEEEL